MALGMRLNIRFHTTMVLTQQWESAEIDDVVNVFPYHYGSYATVGLRILMIVLYMSFHTTMVLTQPESGKQKVLV